MLYLTINENTMNRRLLIQLIAFSLIILTSCNENPTKNSLTKMTLTGKVKAVNETFYQAEERFGEAIERSPLRSRTYEFDLQGNLVKDSRFDWGGNLERVEVHKYDEHGNDIDFSMYNAEGNLLFKEICQYDANGNCVVATRFNEDKIMFERTEHTYDESNQLILIKEFNAQDSLVFEGPQRKIPRAIGFEDYAPVYGDFKYDDRGNWVRSVISIQQKVREIAHRNITYYY